MMLGLRIFVSVILIFSSTFVCAFDSGEGVAKLFSQQSDSIVLIGAVTSQGSRVGSGFIVRSDGLIVTNYHLIKDAEKIAVKLNNDRSYSRVSVLETDPWKDLALIKINVKNLNAVELGNSSEVVIGQRVVSIANPLGFTNTVSDGLVSSWRKVDKGVKLLQISVPLSQGSSGGPLFDLDGKVIGVTTASVRQGQNLNFAIPVNYVKQLLRRAQAPKEDAPMAFSKKHRSYVIQPKDTLYDLARKFKTSVNEIMAVNDLNDFKIYSGQKIRVPLR